MNKDDILYYAGRPLVRSGNRLIYGNIIDRFYCRLVIAEPDSTGVSKVSVKMIDNVLKAKSETRCGNLAEAVEFSKKWIDDHEKKNP